MWAAYFILYMHEFAGDKHADVAHITAANFTRDW